MSRYEDRVLNTLKRISESLETIAAAFENITVPAQQFEDAIALLAESRPVGQIILEQERENDQSAQQIRN